LISSSTDRLPRLASVNAPFGVPLRAPILLKIVRIGSPPGGSILMTSAPQSANKPPASGPAIQCANSITRMPCKGRGAALASGVFVSISKCYIKRS
jgi:hypothetical protein